VPGRRYPVRGRIVWWEAPLGDSVHPGASDFGAIAWCDASSLGRADRGSPTCFDRGGERRGHGVQSERRRQGSG
jgi:hypothetical protein